MRFYQPAGGPNVERGKEVRRRVREYLARFPWLTVPRIAADLGLTYSQVQNAVAWGEDFVVKNRLGTKVYAVRGD